MTIMWKVLIIHFNQDMVTYLILNSWIVIPCVTVIIQSTGTWLHRVNIFVFAYFLHRHNIKALIQLWIGFASFVFILGFMILFIAAIYASPILCGSINEKKMIRTPTELEGCKFGVPFPYFTFIVHSLDIHWTYIHSVH